MGAGLPVILAISSARINDWLNPLSRTFSVTGIGMIQSNLSEKAEIFFFDKTYKTPPTSFRLRLERVHCIAGLS